MKEIGAPTIMKKTAEEGIKQEERIKEELADVLIYSYMMADNLGFDLDEIIEEKLKKNAVKYPVPQREIDRTSKK